MNFLVKPVCIYEIGIYEIGIYGNVNLIEDKVTAGFSAD
jgi:hypothetical protein